MDKERSYSQADLEFFGAVGASISHEMKNVLAIINEMMGLLEDLSRPNASGRPLDPGRLQQIVGRMKAQVDRGNGIMRDLNRFSHSVDQESTAVDLAEWTAFVCSLARRRAALRNVELKTKPAADPAVVTTNPFSLARLIWECLQGCVSATAPGAILELSVEASTAAGGPVVRFTPGSPASDSGAGPASDSAGELAARLQASLGKGADGELKLQFDVRKRTSND